MCLPLSGFVRGPSRIGVTDARKSRIDFRTSLIGSHDTRVASLSRVSLQSSTLRKYISPRCGSVSIFARPLRARQVAIGAAGAGRSKTTIAEQSRRDVADLVKGTGTVPRVPQLAGVTAGLMVAESRRGSRAVAGRGDGDADPDNRQSTDACESGHPARRLHHPAPGATRQQRPRRVCHQPDEPGDDT